ncbi:tyrosine-type recombinase/integrase [Spirosoma sp. RP8]|uniref:Tyrosine-type recombinase/integrase n=1 Tax=Spirosoma liriopis TaxID=2937440 RepID=A0ABT0HUR7_9BACT|nr:tyrosine-type recombinase/integrase [Spirosoma liriopis]MCK8495852.1 tyrosine-type recombinase/integrase [Spirosoma liriopis]
METQTPDFHTRKEQEALLAATRKSSHRLLILLMLDAGCRVTEARTRRWEDCDFRARTVKIDSLKKRKTAKATARTVPMSQRLYEAFEAMLKDGATPKGFVFPGEDNGHIGRSTVNMMLKRISEKRPEVGDTKPHKLRHTFASNLRAQGTDLNDIRDLLGHENAQTTLIYAHADPDRLRAQIDAAAPRPTLLERFKAYLFPPRRTLINLLTPDTDFIVGREKEQKQIQSLVSRGISVLITGPIGIGKTHLLQSLNFEKRTLLIDDCSDMKSSLKAAILHICGDKETAAAMLFQTSDLKSVETKLSTTSLANLVQTLKDLIQPQEYLLKIGTLDGITPKGVKVLEDLKDHFTIITTARSVKMEAASFAWSFEKIELKPLPRPDALKMIYRLIGDLQVSDLDAVMTKLYETSDGNPRKLRELCERLRREPFVNLDAATEVADSYLGRQVEEFDFSVILLVILGGFVLLRYYGRETGEKDLQFIGACIMLIMMFARYFFRSARRKNL